MSYELKYTISQKLRDDSILQVRIYEDGYTVGGTVYEYDALDITLEPNSSGDEPLPAIISSQLNVSFVLPVEDSAVGFPDFLSFNDRKYYVKLYKDSDILWRGFLFNDYVGLPFTTGNIKVEMIAIDGLSFLEYAQFDYYGTDSINSTKRLIDIISETLYTIGFPDTTFVRTSCSYYAQGMLNRSNGQQYEPFAQTYQYRRDFQGLTYYEVLNKIVESFGCILFQNNGEWQLYAINQIADATRYFTRYEIGSVAYVSDAGILSRTTTIEPYNGDNVHFINNSQLKIVRKGYPKIVLNHVFSYPDNFVHNGNFKGYSDVFHPYGWTISSSDSSPIDGQIVPDNNYSSNYVFLQCPISVGTGKYSELRMGNLVSPTAYLPYITQPSFSLSFEYESIFVGGGKLEVSITTSSSVTYYYNAATEQWTTTQTYISLPTFGPGIFGSYSNTFNLYYPNVPTGVTIDGGYVRLIFRADVVGGLAQRLKVRSVKINQSESNVKEVKVTRVISSENSNKKELNQPYGTFYNESYSSNIGTFYNSSNAILKNWYRYGKTESFYYLQNLMARQYSNLLNKNFATVEGDLGKSDDAFGIIYLDRKYLVEDSASSPLSYDGLKFIMNRSNVNQYYNKINSIQLIEITDQDNASTETVNNIF